jgi:hypothetical protein
MLLIAPSRFLARAADATGQSAGGAKPAAVQRNKVSLWAAFWAALRRALAARAG